MRHGSSAVIEKLPVQTSVSRRLSDIRERMSGPGGYYNLGNAFGLFTGLFLYLTQVSPNELSDSIRAATDYLAGSTSSVALTLSMLIFFWSGELYHRAWRNGAPPVANLNRSGDLWSCWGALALGVGLLLLGQPVLALTAGLLHAIGKFGSACSLPSSRWWKSDWPDMWRTTVVFSRVPALIAIVIEVTSFTTQGALFTTAGFGPLTLLVCYLFWLKADLMLFTR